MTIPWTDPFGMFFATMAGLFFSLCSVQAQASNTNNWVSNDSALLTSFASISSSGSPWKVRVSERELQFSYSHAEKGKGVGTISASTSGWNPKPGWCVFVENAERLWTYDGATYLVVHVVKGSTMTTYGLNNLPCPVPDEVFRRLSAEARRAIKPPAK